MKAHGSQRRKRLSRKMTRPFGISAACMAENLDEPMTVKMSEVGC